MIRYLFSGFRKLMTYQLVLMIQLFSWYGFVFYYISGTLTDQYILLFASMFLGSFSAMIQSLINERDNLDVEKVVHPMGHVISNY